MSLNSKPLLYLPYVDVLNFLKQTRMEKKLDFLVINKSDLMKTNQHRAKPVPNLSERYESFTKILESFSFIRHQDWNSAIKTDPLDDRLSVQTNEQRDSLKQNQGQIFHGIGPATNDRLSWDAKGQQTADNVSIPFDANNQRAGSS